MVRWSIRKNLTLPNNNSGVFFGGGCASPISLKPNFWCWDLLGDVIPLRYFQGLMCSICLGILAELSLVEWTWNGATVAATNWLLKEES